MKKYLLLIEDEKMWEKFKETIKKNINDEIFDLIKDKVEGRSKEIPLKLVALRSGISNRHSRTKDSIINGNVYKKGGKRNE